MSHCKNFSNIIELYQTFSNMSCSLIVNFIFFCAMLYLLACLLTFCFAFLIYAYLDLRCATHDDVIEAIETTRNNYPQSNFNRLTNKKRITLPIEKPPSSNTAVD